MAEYPIDQMLPQSEVVEAAYLERMLSNLSSSYKLFWFKGIFTEIRQGRERLEFRLVVARMIAAAWYPVVYYNLSMGANDKLADAIKYMRDSLGIRREEKEENIVRIICESTDKQLLKMIRDFTNLVPYRLIRPFYQQEIQQARRHSSGFGDHKINGLIQYFNSRDEGRALYILDAIQETLTLSPGWIDYLKTNAAVVDGWLNYKLIKYIQERNPNVPAIPFKIFAPTPGSRNLKAATEYWDTVRTQLPLYDIYSQKLFTKESFAQLGGESIDHFIPWSFVLHNEIWNLYPMFKTMNIQKNNKLPVLERYLPVFCEYQYKAFLVAKNVKRLRKITDQYLNVKSDIYTVGDSDRGRDVFCQALRQTIEPLYQIASNQGYETWWYG